MHQPQFTLRALTLCALVSLLPACGGGSSSDGDQPAATAVISGTAAAGSAMVGQVTVKDARGVQRTTDIDLNGHYAIDVNGMTAPFMLRGQSTVGSRNVYYSAAASADVGKTINITPFTDLIVANMAGQLASTYYDNNEGFAGLTAPALDAAKTVLTQRLSAILTREEFGLAPGFDLLRSAFSADHTGFDALMDAVTVTVDPVTSVARILDTVNQQHIDDDLRSGTDVTALPTPTLPLTGPGADLLAIDAQLASLTTFFANGLPAATNPGLLNLFVSPSAFLDDGRDLATFLQQLTTDPTAVGITVSQSGLVKRIDDTSVKVALRVVNKDGTEDGDNTVWLMKKIGGVWKIAGSQHPIDNNLHALNVRWQSASASNPLGVTWLTQNEPVRFERKLELFVDYAPPGIDHVRISGPGLSGPVLLHRSTQWQGFVLVEQDGITDSGSTWLSECGTPFIGNQPCINFSPVPANAKYTFEVLDANRAPIPGKPGFVKTLIAPPQTNSDAQVHQDEWFAKLSSITPLRYASLSTGVTIHLGLAMPTDAAYSFNYAFYSTNGINLDNDLLSSGNAVDFTWDGPAPTNVPSIGVSTKGPGNRRFITLGQHNPPAP